jgi:hypothetical protein
MGKTQSCVNEVNVIACSLAPFNYYQQMEALAFSNPVHYSLSNNFDLVA